MWMVTQPTTTKAGSIQTLLLLREVCAMLFCPLDIENPPTPCVSQGFNVFVNKTAEGEY